MKGLTHFMSGVACASFFPDAVSMAAKSGSDVACASFILALGGLYGIMPDTLDFKFGQFFCDADVYIDCDPHSPSPQKMAEQLGKAIDKCYESGKYVKVQFYPMRLSANLWRQYVIKFDGDENAVYIVINDIVSTSQVPYMGTAPAIEKRVGYYKLKANLLETHGRPSVVDILSGPMFGFKKQSGHVVVEFLPWHRTWSHSYVIGFLLALPVFLIAWMFGFPSPWLYGLIAFLGFAIHLTEDLTGHMGGSLIYPFNKERTNGLCLFKASNPHMNFLVDYSCFVIILYNLWRITTPVNIVKGASTPINPLPWYLYFLYFLVIPIGAYLLIISLFKSEKPVKKLGEIEAEKAISRWQKLKHMESKKYDEDIEETPLEREARLKAEEIIFEFED